MTLFPTEVTPSEERAVAAFMERLRTAPVDQVPRLPGADILRIKARLIREWEAHRKVRLPLEVMAPIEVAAGATAAVLLLLWSVPGAFAWLPRLTL
jgi:type VI protein secretion system component VasF